MSSMFQCCIYCMIFVLLLLYTVAADNFISHFCFSEAIVFEENHPFPFSKMVTLYRKEPFMLEASYNMPNSVPYPSIKIGRWFLCLLRYTVAVCKSQKCGITGVMLQSFDRKPIFLLRSQIQNRSDSFLLKVEN